MEYPHFQDIKPNDSTDFAVLYFSACRTLQKLERAIRRYNNGHLTFVQFLCLKKIHRKLAQMVAAHKNKTNNTKESNMPDITMCANKRCPIRSACYKYRAVPDQYQAYALFEPKLTPTADRTLDWDCDSFWECRDRGYNLRNMEEIDKQKSVFQG